VHKLGRYVLVTESDVSRAERFLEGRGAWAVPVGRMLPFVRAFTSIVAGLVRIPAGRFGVLSLIGTVIYAAALSSAGYAFGSTWDKVSHGLTIVGYVLFVLVVIAIAGFVAYRWRQFRREDQLRRESAAAAAAAAPGAGVGPGSGVGPGAGVGPGSGAGVAAEPRPKPRSHRAGKLDAEVGELVGGAVGQPAPGDVRPGAPVDQHGHADDLGAGLAQRVHRGQRGRAGGGCVLDREYPPSGHAGAFDPALRAVLLFLLPHHERVDRRAAGGRGVHHRGGHRVGAHGEAAGRVVAQVRGQVEHDPAGQRRQPPVEQDPAQVDVPAGPLPRGEHEVPPDHRVGLDRREEFGPVAHER
jgi:SNARE associated Golgi protein